MTDTFLTQWGGTAQALVKQKMVDLGDGTYALATSATSGGTAAAQALGAGENHIGEVGGRTRKLSSTITRPADTTAYAAGDIINSGTAATTPGTISSAARINGGSGVLLNGMLVDGANQAGTVGQYEAWIWSTAPVVQGDNVPFNPTTAAEANLVAIVPFITSYVGGTAAGTAGNRVYQSDPINRGYVCGTASQELYWTLIHRGTYTPVASEPYTLILTSLQD